jgi:hypothetical protein
MIKEHLTPDDIVCLLNDLLEIDPKAINDLCFNRVPCNEELSLHPTVQVNSDAQGYQVGLLGILNGMVGAFDSGKLKGWGCIAAQVPKTQGDAKPMIEYFYILKNEEVPK